MGAGIAVAEAGATLLVGFAAIGGVLSSFEAATKIAFILVEVSAVRLVGFFLGITEAQPPHFSGAINAFGACVFQSAANGFDLLVIGSEDDERYEELMRNPTWSFYGANFPSKEELLEEPNHVFEKHPRTNFVALHVANWPENLDAVSTWLKKYPNMSVEFGAREVELERQPRRARQFFTDFQDRILFGTDSEPDPKMYANYFKWLETADEYFEYWGYPAGPMGDLRDGVAG